MTTAVIVDIIRTPSGKGKPGGALSGVHPAALLAQTLTALVERNGLDTALVDDVIAGCVGQIGDQSLNIARTALLAAGFPESVPGTTVDRQCGSSQQAAHFAAQGVIAGSYDIAIACGVESMSRVPMGSNGAGPGKPFGPRVMKRYHDVAFNQGIGAEMMAERWKVTRGELDSFSIESHRRAAQATEEGRFCNEIIPVPVETENGPAHLTRDEGIRANSTLEKMATLKTPFKPDGVVTAGNASQISDGAAAVLIMERGTAEKLGVRPMARFVEFAMAE